MTAKPRPHCCRLIVFALLAALPIDGARAQTPPPASLQSPNLPAQMPPATSRSTAPVFTLTNPRNDNTLTAPVPAPMPQQLNSQVPVVQQPVPNLRAGEVPLLLNARFRTDMPITAGLHWRIYPNRPDQSGAYRLLKEERAAAPSFALPAGGYIVHVTFGLASAIKTVQLRDEAVRETFELPAGGLRLEGRVGDVRIAPGQISFEIHRGSQFDQGDKKPMVVNVATGDVVLLPEGTYYIVSKYGDGNALVRSDIRVQAGKLTDVTVTHRAAAIMFKLVSRKDGEALANTEWTVVSPSGDVVVETKGAFPRVILAEGEYRVIARNESRSYPQDIKVITGVDGEIEVLAR